MRKMEQETNHKDGHWEPAFTWQNGSTCLGLSQMWEPRKFKMWEPRKWVGSLCFPFQPPKKRAPHKMTAPAPNTQPQGIHAPRRTAMPSRRKTKRTARIGYQLKTAPARHPRPLKGKPKGCFSLVAQSYLKMFNAKLWRQFPYRRLALSYL